MKKNSKSHKWAWYSLYFTVLIVLEIVFYISIDNLSRVYVALLPIVILISIYVLIKNAREVKIATVIGISIDIIMHLTAFCMLYIRRLIPVSLLMISLIGSVFCIIAVVEVAKSKEEHDIKITQTYQFKQHLGMLFLSIILNTIMLVLELIFGK